LIRKKLGKTRRGRGEGTERRDGMAESNMGYEIFNVCNKTCRRRMEKGSIN
jgi:hypothetical protein